MSSIGREHVERTESSKGRRRSQLVTRAVAGVVAAVALALIANGPRAAPRVR
jgi:hypothetical protein